MAFTSPGRGIVYITVKKRYLFHKKGLKKGQKYYSSFEGIRKQREENRR